MYFNYYKLLFNNKIEFKRFNYREIHIRIYTSTNIE